MLQALAGRETELETTLYPGARAVTCPERRPSRRLSYQPRRPVETYTYIL